MLRKEMQENAKADVLSAASEEVIYKIDIPANRYDMLCLEGIARALNIFRQRQQPPTFRLADMQGAQAALPVTTARCCIAVVEWRAWDCACRLGAGLAGQRCCFCWDACQHHAGDSLLRSRAQICTCIPWPPVPRLPTLLFLPAAGKQLQCMVIKPETALVRPFVVCAVLRGVTFDPVRYNSFIDLQASGGWGGEGALSSAAAHPSCASNLLPHSSLLFHSPYS
jgi:hypothetical protein